MGQICGGMAFLEWEGLAHGDLRPENILVDKQGNLRIHDLGSALAIGSRLPAGTEPFARMLAKKEGRGYGIADAVTENFAIGSVMYSIIRGHYPHADEKDFPTLMNMLREKKFPPLTDLVEDEIISMCWNGGYQSVRELEQIFRDMEDGTEWYSFRGEDEDEDWIKEREKECVEWVESGGLSSVLSK
jgi:serine/threonine protein kinase